MGKVTTLPMYSAFSSKSFLGAAESYNCKSSSALLLIVAYPSLTAPMTSLISGVVRMILLMCGRFGLLPQIDVQHAVAVV